MATWLAHMRIAEFFMNIGSQLDCIDFLVGNIAPDCGVPNENWSKFTPEKHITHWQLDGKNIDAENFKETYIVKNGNGFSFYLGYYFHLLTDIAFSQYFKKVTGQIRTDVDLTRKITQDYLHQDFIYLQKNPHSVFYTAFSKIKEFDNHYLDFFSIDAFTKRIHHITNNYLTESTHTVSEFPIIYKLNLDLFVHDTIIFLQEIYNTV
jgi:hypothetical protein